jgi:hypothetical protein
MLLKSTNSEDSHYWKSKTQLESAIGGPLLESEYQEIIALLNNIVKDPVIYELCTTSLLFNFIKLLLVSPPSQ